MSNPTDDSKITNVFEKNFKEMRGFFSKLFVGKTETQQSCLTKRDLLSVRNSLDELIDNATFNNVEWLTFENQNLKCKCVDVYDGDTITLAIPFAGSLYKRKCRLEGIDCAELRTKNLVEKKLGYAGRNFLRELILDKVVWIACGKDDKFGRLLITIYQTEDDMKEEINDLNQLLVEKGFAYPYSGDTKSDFNSWYTKEFQKKFNHDLSKIIISEEKEREKIRKNERENE
jgi:endonuclease YncB( thermonuclease family)